MKMKKQFFFRGLEKYSHELHFYCELGVPGKAMGSTSFIASSDAVNPFRQDKGYFRSPKLEVLLKYFY